MLSRLEGSCDLMRSLVRRSSTSPRSSPNCVCRRVGLVQGGRRASESFKEDLESGAAPPPGPAPAGSAKWVGRVAVL